jgi:hypothetical protein
MRSHLDSNELAKTLGMNFQTVRRNAMHAPWRLWPRARLLESRVAIASGRGWSVRKENKT